MGLVKSFSLLLPIIEAQIVGCGCGHRRMIGHAVDSFVSCHMWGEIEDCHGDPVSSLQFLGSADKDQPRCVHVWKCVSMSTCVPGPFSTMIYYLLIWLSPKREHKAA